jgi:DNA-binding NtrC family response regulator
MGIKRSDDEGTVLAITNCYPSRVALYSAAFHRGWRIEFVKSLALMQEAIGAHRPKAVVYDHTTGDAAWEQHCSRVNRLGIPFVVITNKLLDDTFLCALSAGAFYAAGEPVSSEEILKAFDLAEEVGSFIGKPW